MEYNLDPDEIMGNDKTFLKKRENNLLLSDNDIEILDSNNINYLDFRTLSELIFAITEALEESDDPRLEELSIKLGEYNQSRNAEKFWKKLDLMRMRMEI